MSATPVRVLIVDDHPKVRSGLTAFLATQPDLEVVGTGASGEEAVELAGTTSPDVVLMDVSMPGMGGIEATKLLASAHPGMRIVMLTSFGGRDRFLSALKGGAVGYMLKDTGPLELLRTLRYVAKLRSAPDEREKALRKETPDETFHIGSSKQ